MDARAKPQRLTACSGCAMAPLCEAAEPQPGLPAVSCRVRLERSERLFTAGEPQDAIYAVRAGFLKATVPVPGSGEHIVRFLLPGEVVGLEGIEAKRHATSAIALEACEVCEVPLRRAQFLSDAYPAVAVHLRRLLGNQLARTQSQLAALTHLSAPQRVAAFLLDVALRWEDRGYAGRAFRLPMERREIADGLGLTIETVSRLLADFRARGWVAVRGREVEILDAESLANCPRVAKA